MSVSKFEDRLPQDSSTASLRGLQEGEETFLREFEESLLSDAFGYPYPSTVVLTPSTSEPIIFLPIVPPFALSGPETQLLQVF